jgi:hypothetical protein
MCCVRRLVGVTGAVVAFDVEALRLRLFCVDVAFSSFAGGGIDCDGASD